MTRAPFGLPLNRIRWSAFRSSNMWDTAYPLRRERFVIYQLAMITIVVADCIATYTLSQYLDLEKRIRSQYPGSYLYHDTIIAPAGLTIFSSISTATLYGALFFFLLFWPENVETRRSATFKRIAAVLCALAVTASVIWSTIVGVSQRAMVGGAGAGGVGDVWPPLKYSHYHHTIAWIVIHWIGWFFTMIATATLFYASRRLLAQQPVPLRDGGADMERGRANGAYGANGRIREGEKEAKAPVL